VSRLGLISDIHGNLFAFEAVLAELEGEELDGLVCLGDVAVGPQGIECLARVRELDCPVLQGNWDDWFVNGMPPPKDEMEDRLIQIGKCWADALSEDDRAFLGSFRPLLELELDEGETALCFHGSPRSNEDKIVATTSDETLTEMLADRRADVLIGGHTHLQLMRRHERSLIVNPGSVGMPFTDWWTERVRIAPWAEYGILTTGEGRVRVDLRRTAYDVDAFLQLSLCSGMPHARWWADSWLTDLH
jgi:predicted phosphodiesterase